jgi:hypothetical protein
VVERPARYRRFFPSAAKLFLNCSSNCRLSLTDRSYNASIGGTTARGEELFHQQQFKVRKEPTEIGSERGGPAPTFCMPSPAARAPLLPPAASLMVHRRPARWTASRYHRTPLIDQLETGISRSIVPVVERPAPCRRFLSKCNRSSSQVCMYYSFHYRLSLAGSH